MTQEEATKKLLDGIAKSPVIEVSFHRRGVDFAITLSEPSDEFRAALTKEFEREK